MSRHYRHVLTSLSGLCLALGIPLAQADTTDAVVTVKLGPWAGQFEQTTENRRPLHFAEVPIELSVSCPGGAIASSLDYDFDPAEGVIDPSPASGLPLDDSDAFQKTANQTRNLTAALKPGAIYRVRAQGRCCTRLDASSGDCLEESEPIEVISDTLEIPPVIEAARVLEEGLHYGGLVAGQTLDLTIYDSVPTPGWSIEPDNFRKFLKFTGAGLNFKSSDYTSTNSMGAPRLRPTQEGNVEVTVTVKGKLYEPNGKYLRDYTLVSEPFVIPVTEDPCVLDANFGVFIVADREIECLDGNILNPGHADDDDNVGGGCSSAGTLPGFPSWFALAFIATLSLSRRRCISSDVVLPKELRIRS